MEVDKKNMVVKAIEFIKDFFGYIKSLFGYGEKPAEYVRFEDPLNRISSREASIGGTSSSMPKPPMGTINEKPGEDLAGEANQERLSSS